MQSFTALRTSLTSENFLNLSWIQKAPGQFMSCNHSISSAKYGLSSSSLFSAIISAQFPHTFLLYAGVNGCINGATVVRFFAKEIPSACVLGGIFQSSICIICVVFAILSPSIPFDYDRFNSLCPNRIRACIYPIIHLCTYRSYTYMSCTIFNSINHACRIDCFNCCHCSPRHWNSRE